MGICICPGYLLALGTQMVLIWLKDRIQRLIKLRLKDIEQTLTIWLRRLLGIEKAAGLFTTILLPQLI